MRLYITALVTFCVAGQSGCGSDPADGFGGGGGGGTSLSSGGTTAGPGATTADTASSSGSGTSTGSGGGSSQVHDPNEAGPYMVATKDAQTTVAATGHTFAVRAFFPTGGPTAGDFPIVVIGHGFQLPSSQYEGYAERLASFGYIAVTADFPAGFFGNKHTDNANDLLGAFDWVLSDAELSAVSDATKRGLLGHSLGGKASLLAATLSSEIDAVLALDPVDSAMNCSPTDCPDVSALMPNLAIPTGFVGETLDASGGFQPCAPAADNYQSFYANAQSPSFAVTVQGANHMSFIDDPAACGFNCSLCNPATAAHADVIALSYSYAAAFFETHLRQNPGYQTYLSGEQAQARYVATNLAQIEAK